jgi:uncharacterized protein YlxW (UPF0749 family)
MSRGLTDEPEPQAQEQDELDAVINELIKGQNKLHDRIIDLERRLDHMATSNLTQVEANAEIEAADRKFWKRGL